MGKRNKDGKERWRGSKERGKDGGDGVRDTM